MSALAMGRAMAEARFTETLTFYISHGIVTDPDTLEDVENKTTLYADVAGRIKYPTTTVSDSSPVGQSIASQSVVASVAVGATPLVRTDHFCLVTASSVDPDMVGRTFLIAGRPQSGQVTAHRYPVEEQS